MVEALVCSEMNGELADVGSVVGQDGWCCLRSASAKETILV
jgi:hypothetical protein